MKKREWPSLATNSARLNSFCVKFVVKNARRVFAGNMKIVRDTKRAAEPCKMRLDIGEIRDMRQRNDMLILISEQRFS